jgi:putative ABC transport system permease protein
MLFSETVRLAVETFRASKIRFLLTMLGMVIGSASIILVVTVGMTGTDYALDTINGLGPNKVEMQYAGGSVMGPDNVSTPDYMTRDDMGAVLNDPILGPEIVSSSPMLEFHERINTGNGTSKDTMELGVSPQYKDVRNLRPLAGRFFDDQDAAQAAKVAVIATPALPAGGFASKLFGSPQDAIGRTINIKGMPITVIGVYAESSFDAGQSEIGDGAILIPYEVARYFTGTNTLKELFFTMRNADQVEQAALRITSIIQSRHYAGSVYKPQTLTEVLSIMKKIANALTIVFTLAAAITLIVAGVGIMNSMLANIQARTREIGIRKALGATKREIRLQFLVESIFLSLSGGIVGTIIGMAAPPAVGFLIPIIGKLFGADIPAFSIPVSWWSAVAALATSVLVGVIFGTVPANRAAALDPVETLKYE